MARVLSDGCHCRANTMERRDYVAIGNQELINRRDHRIVPCGPGGTLRDYVPFYFTPYTPMLYNIKTGRGVPKVPAPEIVILVSSLPHLRKMGVPFVFTDRHAYLLTAQYSTDMSDLDRIIWPALQSRDFKKDDADKFEKYQAEALVYKHVSTDALLGVVCYDEDVRAELQTESDKLAVGMRIIARPQWYL